MPDARIRQRSLSASVKIRRPGKVEEEAVECRSALKSCGHIVSRILTIETSVPVKYVELV